MCVCCSFQGDGANKEAKKNSRLKFIVNTCDKFD